MAYVQPSGIIELFKGVNLDNRYMHTLYFATAAKQKAFFDALVVNTLRYTQNYYTRPNRGVIRLKENAENVQNVTYLRFNNRTNKDYYCFVTAINYVNEGVTDIYYEIDVMQTWFFQGGNIQPCMVVREHVSNDTFGLNLEAEPIGSDVYDYTLLTCNNATGGESIDADFSGTVMVMNTSAEPDINNMYIGGVVNGTKFITRDAAASIVSVKNAMLAQLGSWDKNEQSANVIDMYMFPKFFAGSMDDNDQYYPANPQHLDATYNLYHNGKYSNYTPQNNKLFGYPFSFLYVTSFNGNASEYRWEYFAGDVTSGGAIEWKLNASLNGGGMIEIHPNEYNGQTEAFDSKVVMNDFPKCAYAYDAYQAFVAAGGETKLSYQAALIEKQGMNAKRQNFISNAPSAVIQGAAAVGAFTIAETATAGMATAAAPAFAAGGLTTGMGLKHEAIELGLDEARHKIAFEFADYSYEPNIVVGHASPGISVGKGYAGYRFYNCHVRDDEMVRLDNFLSVYGYAVNTVKAPNLTGRPHWNFVMTKDSVITGNMPASSKAAIGRIFDGGIFFWKADEAHAATSNSNIGNFAQQVNSHGQILNK